MRWSGDGDVDDEILEPLQPGSEDALPGYDPPIRSIRRGNGSDRAKPSNLAVVRPRNPRVLRLWLLAGGLGVTSLLQFAAAAYVRGVESDLRDIEAVWANVLQVDEDRAAAHAALVDVQRQYGNSPGLEEQRDTLYDAARARLEKFSSELSDLSVRSDTARALRDEMVAALAARRSHFRRELVPAASEDDLEELEERLQATFSRWRMSPRNEDPEMRLTAARELLERLGSMADETTRLRIGAIGGDRLLLVDVDANEIAERPLPVSDTARIHTVGRDLVVVDGGRARSYPTAPLSAQPRWDVPAERALPAPDGESLWVQVGTQLTRLDPDAQPMLTITIPEGSRLVGAPTPARALIVAPEDGLLVTTPSGLLEPGAEYRRMPRDFRIDTNGTYAAALDDRGRVLIARIDADRGNVTFSALRADLPRLLDLAVIP